MNIISKVRYYVIFFYYKIRIFKDCSYGGPRLFLAELIHLMNAVFKLRLEMPWTNQINEIETIFGRFYFIGYLFDYIILSPAFERPDIERFMQLIKKETLGKSVLLLDIGAHVGLYTLAVSKFVGGKNLKTVAFEPDPGYFILLKRNAKRNRVRNLTLYNVALGDRNKRIMIPGFSVTDNQVKKKKVVFRVKTLDSVLSKTYYRRFNRIFVKIDVEGHEKEVIKSARHLINSGVPITLLIEDCVDPSIINYLKSHDFQFIEKNTPYNSFWRHERDIC